MSDRLLNAQQLADKLGVTPDWVYEQARYHGLPKFKRGNVLRFDLEEVRKWFRNGDEEKAA